MHSTTAYLRRGIVTVLGIALTGYLANYLFNLGLARYMTAEAYGDFKVAYSFALFCGLAVLLGGDRAAPMVLAPCVEQGEPRKVWEYVRFYVGIALVLGSLIALVTWTVSYLHVGSAHPGHHHPLAWVVIAIPINAAGAMISRTLQSARRPGQAALPWRIGLPLLQLAAFAVVVAVHGTLGLVEAVLIGVAATSVIALGQWLWVRRLGLIELARDVGFQQPRLWLGASLPMMGSFVVALTLNQSDLYFLEILGDEAQVGHYAAAETIADLLMLVQTAVVGLVAPIARPAIERGAAESRGAFRQAQTLMMSILIPLALVLATVAVPVLGMFGTQYRAAHAVLLMLIVGKFAWAAAALSSLWLQYQGRASAVLAISIGALVVDSILNLILIPRYGMAGAAAGTAVTLFAAAVAAMWVLWREGRAGVQNSA